MTVAVNKLPIGSKFNLQSQKIGPAQQALLTTSGNLGNIQQPSATTKFSPTPEGKFAKVLGTEPLASTLHALSIPSEVAKATVSKLIPESAPQAIKTGVPFVAGLATDILTPGPGGVEKKVIEAVPDVTKKLVGLVNAAVKEAKPLRREIETAYTLERGRRFGAAEKAVELVGKGEAGFKAQLGKLKGVLIKEEDKPTFMKVKGLLKQEEVDQLFTKVEDFPAFNTGEKIATKAGLLDLLHGKIPQPAQLSKLEDVFGSDLIRALRSKEGLSIGKVITETFNTARALVTSADLSAVLRQGIIQTTRHPLIAAEALPKSIIDAFSPAHYKAWFESLYKDPTYRLFTDSGGYLANATKLADRAVTEEKYVSRWIEKIPLAKQLVGASERAYTSYLNKLRFDSFKQISNKFLQEGLNPKVDKKVFNDLAEMVNIFTGRGNLGSLGRISNELNAAFFSPRLVASRIQALNPAWYIKQSPQVRKESIRSLAQFAGTVMTVAGLASLNDDLQVELDPRSSDFLKIRFGDTRWDIAGGFQQFIRLFAQIATSQRKRLSTGEIQQLAGIGPKKEFPFVETKEAGFPFESQADVAVRFLRGKLSPGVGLLVDLLYGQNVVGVEPKLSQETIENIVPFYIQDIARVYQEMGPDALFKVGVPAFFGVGIQHFEERGSRRAADNL